jgi:hypothetical protein
VLGDDEGEVRTSLAKPVSMLTYRLACGPFCRGSGESGEMAAADG